MSVERRDYLTGKMIDGALAMYEFFYNLDRHSDIDINSLHADISEKYELTESQKQYFSRIKEEISAAIEIVKIIKDEYGLDEKGNIRDKERLYGDIYNEDASEIYSAKPNTYSIGFYLPDADFEDNNLGDTQGMPFIPLFC